MHPTVEAFVDRVVNQYELAELPVLEVGAYDINGSPRSFFAGEYTGIDLQEGPGVDLVMDGHDLSALGDKLWPVIVSTETLEHCQRPWIVVEQMARRLTSDGYLIVTCRGQDERGAVPDVGAWYEDYWRPSVHAFSILLESVGLSVLECVRDEWDPGLLSISKNGA